METSLSYDESLASEKRRRRDGAQLAQIDGRREGDEL